MIHHARAVRTSRGFDLVSARRGLLLFIGAFLGLVYYAGAAGPLRLLPPEPVAPAGWRISWMSEPGALYELQRWDGSGLDALGRPLWESVQRIPATQGTTTAFPDPTISLSGRRFYRIALLQDGPAPDRQPPILAGLRVEFLGTLATASVRLVVTATDDTSVREVAFFVDDFPLENARREDNQWVLDLPYADLAGGDRLTARATDLAGNTATAQVAIPRLTDVTRRFVALDADGRPAPATALTLAPGALPPLQYLPGGAVAERESLSVRLPRGSQLVVAGAREVLTFTEAEVRFGRDTALSIDLDPLIGPAARMLHMPAPTRTLSALEGGVRIVSTSPLELPTGSLTASDLESLLGLAPGAGVPLRVFGRFSLRWHTGVLEDGGIRGGRFSFSDLPLPARSGDYPDHVLPLTGVEEIRLPYHGRFAWVGGGAGAAQLALSPADPGWLILRPDGSMGWRNRSEIRLPGGGRFRADLNLDDPVYRMQIFADSVQVPLIGNLAQLILPDDPGACLSPGLDTAMLTRATGCLEALGLAYHNVSASAVAAVPVPEDPEVGGLPVPPDDVDTSVSVLNAWGHRAVAAVGPVLPLAPQRELLSHTGKAATAATDLLSAARHRAALARALTALHRGTLTGTSDDISALNTALDEATAAALLRARDAGGISSYAALLQTLAALVETQTLLAEAGRPAHLALHQAAGDRLQEFLSAQLDALGIVSGQFQPAPNSRIATENRFTVFQHLHELLDAHAQAALLEVEDQLDVPLEEALTQMGLRLWTLLESAFAESEASRDLPGFLYAFEDLLDLQASRQLSIFPNRPELAVIPMPGSAAFLAIFARLDALWTADLQRPYPERTLNNEQVQLRRLTRILREIPASVTVAAAPFERAHERVNAKLTEAAQLPGRIDSADHLVRLIDLGTLNERLRRRMNLPLTTDWENATLPILVTRLTEVARARGSWSELNRARVSLLDESRFLAAQNEPARRRHYLEQTVPVLAAARDVAVALWDSERSRRELSLLEVADLALPGDLTIDRLAGSATAHRKAGWISGAFRGRAQLPKFQGRFEVLNASFDQAGTFQLALHGSASFQGVSLGVTRRQPLVVSYQFPGPMRLHGEGLLALPNGMSFAARLQLDDPLYGFRLEARDLRFQLARELTVLRPTLDTTVLEAATNDLRRAVMDYYGSMNAALEALARQAGNLPDLESTVLGQPPTFQSPQITLPFSELNAWSSSILLTAQQGANRSHALTVSSLRQVFQTLHDDATLAAETLETEAQFLDLQRERLAVLRRGAKAFQTADERLLLGVQPDVQALQEEAQKNARAEARLHLKHLFSRPPQSLAESSRHTRVLLDIAAAGQQFGADFSDLDDDSLPNDVDNCPALWSSGPLPDADNDGFGDACDAAPLDASIPGNDPCANALRLAGQPQPQAQALLICQYRRELTGLGFDPITGSLIDVERFHRWSADEIEFRHSVMLQLEVDVQALGLAPGTLPSILDDLLARLLELRAEQLRQTPESDAVRRFELALEISDLRMSAGPGVALDAVVGDLNAAAPSILKLKDPDFTQLQKVIQERKRRRSAEQLVRLDETFGNTLDAGVDPFQESRRRGVVGDSLILLTTLGGALSPERAAYRARVDLFIRNTVNRLRSELVDPQFLAHRLGEAKSIAEMLADFTGWLAATGADDEPLVNDLRLAWSDFTVQLTAVGEARRAWWLLHQYAGILHTSLLDHGADLEDGLTLTLRQSFAASILASDRILSALASLADAVGTESFKATLPGELRVRRIFGGLLFDRETELWTGHFGGRLEFPEFQKAFFEISQATIATDGSFQIAASTGGPLPFGRLGLTTSLQIAGSLSGLQSVTGAGQLAVPLSTTTNLYAVTVGYDFNANRLRFDTQANGLDWRLDDDFVLMNGGFGIEFSTAEPDGALAFRGSAGLFARQTPLPSTLHRTNFHLLVTNAAIRLAAGTESLSVALTNGTLMLPEFFRTSLCATNRIFTNFLASPQGQTSLLHGITLTNPPAPASLVGPAVSLSPTNPITVSFQYQPAALSFSGALQFRDLGFQVPEFEPLEFAICQARLVFPSNGLPVLTNVFAAFQFPLPNQTNIIEVADASITLTGLPLGTVRLRTNLDLYRDGDWRLSLLGRESALCPSGTGFTLKPDPANDQRLTLRFDAGMEFAVPAAMLSDETGGALAAAACGSLSIPVDRPPFLGLDGLGLSIGRARLGGTNGLTLTNASLQLSGFTNLFSPSPANPFLVRLGGAILVGPAGFGLSNAVFHFEGQNLPRFTVSEVSLIQPGSILGLSPDLPLHIDEARVRFLREDLPLPSLFAATNLSVAVSGEVALPSKTTPILASRVRDLVVTFLPDGQPRFSVDGLGFAVDLATVVGDSDLLALGGEVYVGGLQQPPNYLFAGKLKGKLKGNAVEGLIALDACGVRGICFGLAGSELNLSIGYGFVLTGARGGVSFANVINDPCSFVDQLPIDPITGRPTGPSPCSLPEPPECPSTLTLDDLRPAAASPARGVLQNVPNALSSDASLNVDPTLGGVAVAPASISITSHSINPPAIPCPTIGECPPAAVNIQCMPHPENGDPASPYANRVIYKFTSIDESRLNAIGITPQHIEALVPDFAFDPRTVALDLAHSVRSFIESITPRASADAPPAVRAVDDAIPALLDQVELGFANSFFCALQGVPASSSQLATLVYEAIREAAYAGVACQDLTLKLEGSVSYVGLASFANVSGGVVLSTTGSAGVVGAVNVLGIPVGQARAFVSSTDAQGNPIFPSMCGELVAALGPLELGSLAYLNDCPDCTTALFEAFTRLPTRLNNAYTFAIMQAAHPELADPSLSAAQHLNRLQTPEQRMAFLAATMHTPPTDANGQISTAFLDFLVELADAVQPRWAMCGEVQPKLFGFPLSGGGKLYGYQFYAGPNLVDGRRQGYLLRDTYAFSPLQLMANYATAAFTAGLGSLFVPALDEAQASTSLLLPTLGQIVRDGFTLPPPDFAARRTRDFLANAVQTFSYRLAPFGMELGRAGGRILLPSLDHHPRGPSPRVPPALRNQGLPDELDVLLAALGDKDRTNAINRLADVQWRGEGDADFASLFAGTRFATAINRRNLSLRDDYFPHGGFLGAGLLDFPALLASPMPPSLGTALDQSQPAATRLVALQDFISNHLLKTVRVGEMAFYIPAPNPPVDRFPTSPQELVESLRNFVPTNPLHLSSYYPGEEGFFQGWIEAPILGLPTLRSRATWLPQAGLMRMDAEVPTNSWFNRYVNRAQFALELRGNTNQPDTVLNLFSPLSNQVARLTPTNPGLSTSVGEVTRDLPGALANGLPKVSLALSASQIRIPVPTYNPAVPLTDALTVARIQNATLEAYSPFYRRPGASGTDALDRVRRDGGVAVLGDFNFLNGTLEVPRAQFAVSPNPDPLGLPQVTGTFSGEGLRLFGIPFGAATDSRAARLDMSDRGPAPADSARSLQTRPSGSAQIEFRSDASTARLSAVGSVPSVALGPLFSLVPISGSAIGATATFQTTTADLPQGSLTLQPCELSSALFGGPALRLHGASSTDPFTLSTTGPWRASATVAAGSGLELRVGSTRVLRLTRSADASTRPFRATLTGDGLASGELAFDDLNLGLILQTYPDALFTDPRRRTFTLAPGAIVSLRAASDGTFTFRALIREALPLANTPFAALNAGFELNLSNAGLSFSGNASGGLWASLGGGPISLNASARSDGWSFDGSGTLPPLAFGVFRIDDGAGRGPTVAFSQSHLSLPSGLSLRIESAALGNPALTLDPFLIAPNGAFEVTARQSSTPSFLGILFSSASHALTRNAAGVIAYSLQGQTPARTLAGFGSITPRSGSTLRGVVTLDATGHGSLLFDAALLRLPLIGLTTDVLLHGAGNTTAPFGFSTTGPWSAVATFTNLIADPPGALLPEWLRLTPASAGASLFTAAVTGDQGNLTGLSGTRTGNVNLDLFRNSPMARTLNNISAGTIALAVTNSPRRLRMTLDPPDLTYSTNLITSGSISTIPLFRLSSGSLQLIISGDAREERSMTLETPSLTLLPGTLLEQTLAALPTQSLAAHGFSIQSGTTLPTLTFPGLPAVRLHASPMFLRSDGFNSLLSRQLGRNYSGLVAFGESTNSLTLDFSGTRLRLNLASGVVAASALGKAAPFSGATTLDVTTSGLFTGTFQVGASPAEDLAVNLLGFQANSTAVLSANVAQPTPVYSLAGSLALVLTYPNPANPTQSLTAQPSLTFDLESAENFSASVTSGLPSFDLGWLRLQRGDAGHVLVTRNGATGTFAVAFNDWDMRLFGVDFNDQDFTVSSTGVLTRSLPASTLDFGSGTGLLRLATGGPIPFEWVANSSAATAGRTQVDLPSTTALTLPGVSGLAGTLASGLGFGTALEDIPATGVFDRTWNRNFTLNGLDFGNATARLRRATQNGPLQLTVTRSDALWTGLNLAVSFNSGTAGSFAAALTGNFAFAGWNFGSVNFTYVANDPIAPFQGLATITDPSGNIGVNVSVKLRGGSQPCLEFTFAGVQRQLCIP